MRIKIPRYITCLVAATLPEKPEREKEAPSLAEDQLVTNIYCLSPSHIFCKHIHRRLKGNQIIDSNPIFVFSIDYLSPYNCVSIDSVHGF